MHVSQNKVRKLSTSCRDKRSNSTEFSMVQNPQHAEKTTALPTFREGCRVLLRKDAPRISQRFSQRRQWNCVQFSSKPVNTGKDGCTSQHLPKERSPRRTAKQATRKPSPHPNSCWGTQPDLSQKPTNPQTQTNQKPQQFSNCFQPSFCFTCFQKSRLHWGPIHLPATAAPAPRTR